MTRKKQVNSKNRAVLNRDFPRRGRYLIIGAEELRRLFSNVKTEYIDLAIKRFSDYRFGDWMEFWYENYSKPAIRPLTQQNYENRIYDHIIPDIGKIPLNKLTQNDLQQFYARLKRNGRKQYVEKYGPGLSDRMVRACHASCRSALEKAVEDGLIRTNPAIGCKLPPKKAHEMQVLSREDLGRFLRQAKEDGFYEFFLLELGTDAKMPEVKQTPKQNTNTPVNATYEPTEPHPEPVPRKIRKSGTGCVYQINDHLWEGSFYPRLPNGKRKKFNVYAETRDQCEAKLAEMITEKKAEIAEMKKTANA